MTATTPSHALLTSESRFTRLAHQVKALRTRTAFGRLDVWMLVIGGVLMPVGIAFIIIGWSKAAKTPLPFEQTPYLISGGILGLALVIAGGFVYFGYWETVRIRESREQSQQLNATMLRLEALMQAAGVAAGETTAADTFVATANGSI